MENVTLQVTGLSKRYGSVLALDGATLRTEPSWRCLGVVGRNAAGKTTLLRILVGLLEKDAGEVDFVIEGRPSGFADPTQAFFIGELPLLPESLTGREYLAYQKALNATLGVGTTHEVADEVVDRLELKDQIAKPIRHMSKGTKRKLELLAALSSDIPLVIADELTEGLDIPSRRAIQDILRRAGERGVRFLVSSHDVSFIVEVADQVAVIDQGRCVDLFNVSSLDKEAARERIYQQFEAKDEAAG